ncbi:uncharacterized protein [Diadema setosum]|uniref:uncharacterized protein n=1 Tax=Diadema setosum TaxID=31175 RepID=UPI003B3B903D
MPNLTTLKLMDVNITDDFFVELAASASSARLEAIHHARGPGISAAASKAYAKSICTMPNLKTLELMDVKINDDFFVELAASASSARIQQLIVHRVAMSASVLQSISCLPCLNSLTVRVVKNKLSTSQQGNTMEKAEIESGLVRSPIVHLCVDDISFPLLWQLNVASMCPKVKKVSFWMKDPQSSSSDIDKAWPLYSHNVELDLPGHFFLISNDGQFFPSSACKSLLAPRTVTSLSVTDKKLGNENTKKFIRILRSYPHLKNISLIRCNTSEELDPYCEKVNAEGKLLITVEHGSPRENYTFPDIPY